MEINEILEGLKKIGGEFNTRTKSDPKMETWRLEGKLWSKGDDTFYITRIYVTIICEGESITRKGKRNQLGFIQDGVYYPQDNQGGYVVPNKVANEKIAEMLESK